MTTEEEEEEGRNDLAVYVRTRNSPRHNRIRLGAAPASATTTKNDIANNYNGIVVDDNTKKESKNSSNNKKNNKNNNKKERSNRSFCTLVVGFGSEKEKETNKTTTNTRRKSSSSFLAHSTTTTPTPSTEAVVPATSSIHLLHLAAFIIAILAFSNITITSFSFPSSSSSSLLPSSSSSPSSTVTTTTTHYYDDTIMMTISREKTTIGHTTPPLEQLLQLPPPPLPLSRRTTKLGTTTTSSTAVMIFVDAFQQYPYNHIDRTTTTNFVDSRRRRRRRNFIHHRRTVRDHVQDRHCNREGMTANSNSLVLLFGTHTPTPTTTIATTGRTMNKIGIFAKKNDDCYYGPCSRTSRIGYCTYSYPRPLSRRRNKRTTTTVRLWMSSESASNKPESGTVLVDRKKGTRGPSAKQEALWKQRLDETKQYQDENNGSSYPPRGTPLGYWANWQRASFKKNQMYTHRIELLNSINFQWSKPRRGPNLDWDRMYDRLVEYKKRCGDTKVPQNYPKDQQLGFWCYNQKVFFHKGTLDSEKKAKLDGIGFVFDEIVSIDDRWDDKYERLVEYWKKHNSTIVPHAPGLGMWVEKQRFLYNKNDSRLTPERIERLEAIGFVWDALEAKWQEMYKHIVEYKQENGNADVENKHPTLGAWVNNQRTKYRKGKIPPDRIEKLEAIGFKWRIKESKQSKKEKG